MNMHARLGIAFLWIGLVLLHAGCKDSAAQERQRVQKDVSEAAEALRTALLSGKSIELSNVVNSLGAINGGDPGQQAAKSLLVASAHRELATLELAEADQIEAAHRTARSGINSRINAVLTLDALASGLESIDANQQRQELQSQLDAARQKAGELSAAIDQLDGPISQQTEQNTAQNEAVAQLRLEVGELRRKAQELGHSAGLDTYRRAVATRREADKIEFEIGKSEAELRYERRPERDMAASERDALQSLVESIEAAQQELDSFGQTAGSDASTSRKKIDELAGQIDGSLQEIQAANDGALKAAYDEALASLEKAASQAQNASRNLQGDDAQAARLMTAGIQETIGRLHWSRAHGLADELAVLQRLADAGQTLEGEKYSGEIKSIGAARDQAIEAAKTAYAGAQETLSQVQPRGDADALNAFKTNVDDAIASLEGKKVDEPELPLALPAGDGESAPEPTDVAPAPVTGFATPEEVLAAVVALRTNGESLSVNTRALLDMTRTTSAEGKAARAFVEQLIPHMEKLHSAMVERYGADETLNAFDAAGMALYPDFSNSTPKLQGDDRASFAYTAATGQTKTDWLIKVNDLWYLDGDKLDAEDRQMLAVKDMIGPAMMRSLDATAAKVAAGEYASAAEAIQGMQQALMGGMTPPMGGPTGGGAPNK